MSKRKLFKELDELEEQEILAEQDPVQVALDQFFTEGLITEVLYVVKSGKEATERQRDPYGVPGQPPGVSPSPTKCRTLTRGGTPGFRALDEQHRTVAGQQLRACRSVSL